MFEILIPSLGWLVAGFAAVYIHQVVYVSVGFLLRCSWVELGSGSPRFTLTAGDRRLVVRRRWWNLGSIKDFDHRSLPSSRRREIVRWSCSAASVGFAAVWVSRLDFSAIAPEHREPWMYPTGYLIMMLAVEGFISAPWCYPYGARLSYALTGSTRHIDKAMKSKPPGQLWEEQKAWFKLMRSRRSKDHAGNARAAGLLFDGAVLDGSRLTRMPVETYSMVAKVYIASLTHLERFEEAVSVAERYAGRVEPGSCDAALVLCLRCAALTELGRHEEALVLLESLDRSFGPHITVTHDALLLTILLRLGRYEEAFDRSYEFLSRSRYDAEGRFEIEHVYVYILALLGRVRGGAEEMARRCFERTPEVSVGGTLGAVLVQVGDAAEGIRLLQQALPIATQPLDRLETLRFLVIGHRRLGEVEISNRYRDQAIDAHPLFAYRLDSLPPGDPPPTQA